MGRRLDGLATLYCDGVNCDAAAVESLLRAKPVRRANGRVRRVRRLPDGVLFLSIPPCYVAREIDFPDASVCEVDFAFTIRGIDGYDPMS